MSSDEFEVSYPAATQLSLLSAAEKKQLVSLFSSDAIHRPDTTEATGDGRFVSRLGNKRVLWRATPQNGREIVSIVDRSFLRG